MILNKPALFRLTALVLTAAALAAVPAGAKPAHGKKAAPARKRPAPAKAAASSWKPDAKLLALLQPETQLGPFSMRLPAGYTVQRDDVSNPTTQVSRFFATGPKRAEGSFPVIFVLVGVATPGYRTGSADGLLDGNVVINEKPGLVKSGFEDSEANGLIMVRQYFKYPARPGSGRLFHGFHYATTDGTTDAIVAAMDIEPGNADTLPLAEAAALTLHKTP